MSQPQPAAKPADAKPADQSGPRIPISMLHSHVERQWPDGNVSSVCQATATAHPSQRRMVIDFLPRIGMYEIRMYEPDRTEPRETRLVPKEWASGTVAG